MLKKEMLLSMYVEVSEYVIAYALNAESFVENVPETIEQLQKLDDWPDWKKAIDKEMTSLAKSNTWQLVDLPVGC